MNNANEILTTSCSLFVRDDPSIYWQLLFAQVK